MNIWFLNKIIKFFAIITYPLGIVPKVKYRSELNLSDIFGDSNCGIVRRSILPNIDTFDKFGHVKEAAILSSIRDIQGLSLNLLGQSFLVRHISYIPTKIAGKGWDGNEKYLWVKYIKYVQFERKPTPIYFLFSDLNNIQFPYLRRDDKDTQRLVKALKLPLREKGEDVTLYGVSMIKHRPGKMNYWHIEFTILDINGRNYKSGYAPKEIKRQNIESSIRADANLEDSSSMHWSTNAAIHAINDILINSAYKTINYSSTKIAKKDYFDQNKIA